MQLSSRPVRSLTLNVRQIFRRPELEIDISSSVPTTRTVLS